MDERDDRGPQKVAALMERLAKAGAEAADSGDSTYQFIKPNFDEWLPRWRESCDRDFKEWQSQWRASHPDEVEDADESKPKRRQRKPSIRSLIKRAEKAGKPVTSVTTPEGYTLSFGEPAVADQTNDLDKWLAKRHAH